MRGRRTRQGANRPAGRADQPQLRLVQVSASNRGEAFIHQSQLRERGHLGPAVLGAQRGRGGGRGGGDGLQAQALGARVFPDHPTSRGGYRCQGLRPDHQPSLVGGILPLQPRPKGLALPGEGIDAAREQPRGQLLAGRRPQAGQPYQREPDAHLVRGARDREGRGERLLRRATWRAIPQQAAIGDTRDPATEQFEEGQARRVVDILGRQAGQQAKAGRTARRVRPRERAPTQESLPRPGVGVDQPR